MLLPTLLVVASPQTPTLQLHQFGEEVGDGSGTALELVGDWDGDGVDDYAVGIPGADVPALFSTLTDHGRVEVRSGATAELIAATADLWPTGDASLGWRLAGGFDSDEDGLPEIAALARERNEVVILERFQPGSEFLVQQTALSPITTLGVAESLFGDALENVGDVNGDGQPDLAIGSPLSDRLFLGSVVAEDAGALRVVSGADWSQIALWTYPDAFARFGSSVASVADMNGNGGRDLAIGAPGRTAAVTSGTTQGRVVFNDPQVFVPSSTITEYVEPASGTGFGSGVLEVPDLFGGSGSELLVGSLDSVGEFQLVSSSISPQLLAYERVDRGELTLLDLDTLTPLWTRGGAGDERFDGRSLALGDIDSDGTQEPIVVRAATPTRSARVLSLRPSNGLTEFSFDAASGLGLTSRCEAIVGPDLDGDERPDLLFGTPRLENGRGGVFGYSLFADAPGPQTWLVDQNAADGFTGIAQATMVARAGDTILVNPGTYDFAGIGEPLTLLGNAQQPPAVLTIDVKDAGTGRVEDLLLGRLRLGGNAGRVTVESVEAERIEVFSCDDVTVLDSRAGPGAPGLFTDDSRVEVVTSELRGSPGESLSTTPGHPALIVGGGSDVLVVESQLYGADESEPGPFGMIAPPGPAVQVTFASTLDLRGGSATVVQGGTEPGNPLYVPVDIEGSAGSELILSSTLPPLAIVTGGFVTNDSLLRPWIDYESVAPLGSLWTVETHAESGALGALYLCLAPLNLPLPQLLDVPAQVDPTQAIDIRPLVGGGLGLPDVALYPISALPALAGLELHVQAVIARGPGVFDATNGGSLVLR